ncbi:MAG: hypothetical protein EOO17_03935 [Chloroflexi bacterium]|nr:MAG: hypothetical protein EOO17_03935 [Chloroflexota bacterium]
MSPTITKIQPIRQLLCRDPFVWKLYLQLRDIDLLQLLMDFDQPKDCGNVLGISRETLSRRILTDAQIDTVEAIISKHALTGVCSDFHTIIGAQLPADIPRQHLFPFQFRRNNEVS